MDHTEAPLPGSPGSDVNSLDSRGSYKGPLFKLPCEDGLEDPEIYCQYGYHPVHLGDYFGNNNRYKVLHKLGSGGFATVWLCRDLEAKVYVALKILTADASEDDCAEVKFIKRAWDRKQVGWNQLALPTDYFWFNGPNGRHLCLVLPILGPRVSEIWDIFQDPGTVSRSIATQVVSGLQFLHKNHLCHGDLQPANILLRLSNLDNLDEDQIYKEFGEPATTPLLTISGEVHELSTAPRYLVQPIRPRKIPPRYLTEQVCIIDFGESYDFSVPPKALGIPVIYSSPENIFHDPVGPASDIWALACTLFEIRSRHKLFDEWSIDEDDTLLIMVLLFGKFPEPWWSSWKKRDHWFDNEGKVCKFLADGTPAMQPLTLEESLAKGYHYISYETGKPYKSFTIPKDEIILFVDLLSQMLVYEPSKRITAAQVAEHQWFAKS